MTGLFGVLLWMAGAGHFCLLPAALQVPRRFRWREDLARIAPFNRKLLWTYAAFTLMTILAFGVLTLLLREEMLRGDRAALALAAFMGLYWTARLGVDLFWFRHDGWPPGARFVVGHILLTSLFVGLAGTYVGLLLWQAWRS